MLALFIRMGISAFFSAAGSGEMLLTKSSFQVNLSPAAADSVSLLHGQHLKRKLFELCWFSVIRRTRLLVIVCDRLSAAL